MELYMVKFAQHSVMIEAASVDFQAGVQRYVFLDTQKEIVAVFPAATLLGYWKQAIQKS
jgi:hypothetical protein